MTLPAIHDDLIKEMAALIKKVTKKADPKLIATEMLRLVNDDIVEHPDLWPKDLETQMAEANVLISEHFS